MKHLKYFIPLIIILILPWTHRLVIENIMLATPWVERPTAEGWSLGVWFLAGLGMFLFSQAPERY